MQGDWHDAVHDEDDVDEVPGPIRGHVCCLKELKLLVIPRLFSKNFL